MTSTSARRAAPPVRRRRGFWSWLFTALGLLVVLALIVAGFYVWRVWSTASDVRRDDSMLPASDNRPDADAAAAGSYNYVLMGSDARGDERGRSDVLMLAHVPPSRDKVYVVSFPRDMWVQIPHRGAAKINAAYAWGGPALATETVESLVGVRMDHAVQIDFEGFISLTSQLGGVTVDNRVASREGRYSWPKGKVTLQGEEALAYVRQRYGLPNGDLDRAERQRAVVKGVLQKLLSRDLISNPVMFSDVMGQLGRHFTVDSGLTNEVLFSTATSLRVNSGDDIGLLQAPITGFGRSSDGQSIDVVNEAQLAELATSLQKGTMTDYYERYKDQPFVPRP